MIRQSLAVCLIACLASANCVTAQDPPAEEERDPASYIMAPVVQQLLSLDARDEAFRRIIRRQKYRGAGTYLEKDAKPVDHVVVCPQRRGAPMLAVFPHGQFDNKSTKHQPKGHVVLVDSGGAIVRVYSGANSLDGDLKDVNGDGVLDVVESWRIGGRGVEAPMVVHIIPLTPDQRPALRVAFRLQNEGRSWGWRLVPGPDPLVLGQADGQVPNYELHIGPKDGKGNVTTKAAYRWSFDKQEYVGPVGDLKGSFQRLEPTGFEAVKKFAEAGPKKAVEK